MTPPYVTFAPTSYTAPAAQVPDSGSGVVPGVSVVAVSVVSVRPKALSAGLTGW